MDWNELEYIIPTMSFARSYYADQKPAPPEQQQQEFAAAVPPSPIPEEPLSPAQIQEAIRMYRTVQAQSPLVHQPTVPPVRETTPVDSAYYSGPSDIPQSYKLQYMTTPQRHRPAPQTPVTTLAQEQLLEQLRLLSLQNAALQAAQTPLAATPSPSPNLTRKVKEEDGSGYCVDRKKCVVPEEPKMQAPAVVVDYTRAPASYPTSKFNQQVASGQFKMDPSQYLGMENNDVFLYDVQKNRAPETYTMVQPQEPDVDSETMTEDVTQQPGPSPAVNRFAQSRFRGLIKEALPSPKPAPIVVERVEQETYPQFNYNAFRPTAHDDLESEYQLPMLNDLASCIEKY